MTNDSNPQPMNTERKVKTVLYRYSPIYSYLGYRNGDVIRVLSSIENKTGYLVYIPRLNGGTIPVDASLDDSSPFQVLEFHEEEPSESANNTYATIADVERMIREAMGKDEKKDEDEENQKDIFSRIASDVRSLEYKWRLYDKGAIKRTPPDIDSLIKDWLEQYTITKKNP